MRRALTVAIPEVAVWVTEVPEKTDDEGDAVEVAIEAAEDYRCLISSRPLLWR